MQNGSVPSKAVKSRMVFEKRVFFDIAVIVNGICLRPCDPVQGGQERFGTRKINKIEKKKCGNTNRRRGITSLPLFR